MAQENVNSDPSPETTDKQKVLLIGSGGIGCEVLKNLVLCGVNSITVIDLDTIEVSNLNRQFLFRREHVGMSKATVAADAMRKIRPTVDIQAIHGNVLDNNILSLNFIRQFVCVINALDNILARSHVNRLCMAANVPLIETGSAGYLGQASFIAKGLTECYDCTPRKDDRNRTYPACTIRNTPSEPAHCVIWAKYLFSQLFGDVDPEAEVSPDPDDPELGKNNNKTDSANGPSKVSTRQWAEDVSYNPMTLLNKLFREDVKYLLRLDSLWKKRTPPVPLDFIEEHAASDDHAVGCTDVHKRDHEVWSQEKCVATFSKSVALLRERMVKDGSLSFDKDDDLAIDFVTSAANLRCTVFHIAGLKRFSAKSIAGNIIAAIATTNSVIAGSAVVMAVLNILSTKSQQNLSNGLHNNVQQLLLRRNPVPTGRVKNRANAIFVAGSVQPPNPACYVCSPSSRNSCLLEIAFDFEEKCATLKAIQERLLKSKLHFAAPELVTTDGRVLISGDEEDNDESAMNRILTDFGASLTNGIVTVAEDMIQDISVSISFSHAAGVSFDEALENFQPAPRKSEPVVTAAPIARPASSGASRKRPLDGAGDEEDDTPAKRSNSTNGNGIKNGSNGNHAVHVIDDDDDVVMHEANGSSDGLHNENSKKIAELKQAAAAKSNEEDDNDCVLVL